MNNKKYKIGIIGETMQDDFGSIMEYLGLCEYIKNSGVSYIVIPPAGKKDWCKTSVPLFTEKYNCSKKLPISQYNTYNNIVETYLLGPGSNWDIKKHSGINADYCSYILFNDNCKMTSYGTSFILDYPSILISKLDKHLEYKQQLSKFNIISVSSQEDSNILKDFYEIDNCASVISSMFLPKRQFFLDFIKNKKQIKDNVLTIYPLNTISRRETALDVSNKLNCGLVKIATGNTAECKKLIDFSIVLDNIEISNPPENPMKFDKWLETIFNSKYIMCCDYYSLCICIMFMKNFVVFEDSDDTRISFLVNKLGLQDRMIKNYDTNKAVELFNSKIVWEPVYKRLRDFKEKSILKLNKMLSL